MATGTVAAAFDSEGAAAGIRFAPKGDLHRPLDLDLVIDTRTATKLAGAGGIRAQFLPQYTDRIKLLIALYVGDDEAAERIDAALLREAVAAVSGATGRLGRPMVHDACTPVGPCPGSHWRARLSPAGSATSGSSLAKSLPAGVDDLAGRRDGVHRHRCGRTRVKNAALRRHDLDGAERPFVARNVGSEEGGERGVDARPGVGDRAVLKAADLRVRFREVHLQPVAGHRDRHLDRDVHRLEAIVFETILTVIDTVRQVGDGGPQPAVGVVEHA